MKRIVAVSFCCGALASGVGARLRVLSGAEVVDDLAESLRRQVLVVVVVDLGHRSIAAGAKALDLLPGEKPIRGQMIPGSDLLVADPY